MSFSREIAESLARETSSGYWSVQGHYFLSKVECFRYATEIKDFNVKFHYNDEFYSSLSWKNEPSESLPELYKRRAQQIRDKYKYVILAYSGGADSYNVMHSFLDNDIPIDEIICTYPIKAIEKLHPYFSPTDKRACNLIFEFSETAKPELLKLSQQFPNTKISILDHTELAIKMLSEDKLHLLPVGGLGTAPSLAGHFMIAERLREYNDKGTSALVTGCDKPRMGYSPKYKSFGVWFDDITLCWGNHTKEQHSGFRPAVEHFYYTTDLPALWQKQCHVMRNVLEPMAKMDVRSALYDKLHAKTKDGNEIFWVHDYYFKHLFYGDKWKEGFFQAGKPTGYFFQEHGDWFFKTDLVDQRAKDFHYHQVIDFMTHGVDPSLLVYDTSGKPLKFKEMQSQILSMR